MNLDRDCSIGVIRAPEHKWKAEQEKINSHKICKVSCGLLVGPLTTAQIYPLAEKIEFPVAAEPTTPPASSAAADE